MVEHNGEVTTLFGGEQRTFKFGYKSLSYLEQKEKDLNGYIETIAGMLWSGLMAKQKDNNLPPDFDIDTVLGWMDESNEEELAQLLVIAKKRADSMKNLGTKAQESMSQNPAQSPNSKVKTGS